MLRYCANCKKEFDFPPRAITAATPLICPECGSEIPKESRRPDQGREADAQELAAKAKRIYLEQDSPFGPVGTINLYIKPEDNAAYYVINDAFTGAISL